LAIGPKHSEYASRLRPGWLSGRGRRWGGEPDHCRASEWCLLSPELLAWAPVSAPPSGNVAAVDQSRHPKQNASSRRLTGTLARPSPCVKAVSRSNVASNAATRDRLRCCFCRPCLTRRDVSNANPLPCDGRLKGRVERWRTRTQSRFTDPHKYTLTAVTYSTGHRDYVPGPQLRGESLQPAGPGVTGAAAEVLRPPDLKGFSLRK
jgi:hypothetical protein